MRQQTDVQAHLPHYSLDIIIMEEQASFLSFEVLQVPVLEHRGVLEGGLITFDYPLDETSFEVIDLFYVLFLALLAVAHQDEVYSVVVFHLHGVHAIYSGQQRL